jgi:rare lipoprotein A (peptidoglycan hydrolase)
MSIAVPTLAQPVAMRPNTETPQAVVIVGTASFYDEFSVTSSGEAYDPKAFTAAVQLALRDRFGGVKSGANYRAVYVIAEFGGKRAVLKINNVGTLKAGRLFDLSRAAMEYFDGIEKGLIDNLKVTILPLGRHYTLGPLSGEVEEVLITVVPPAAPLLSPAMTEARHETAAVRASLDQPIVALPAVAPRNLAVMAASANSYLVNDPAECHRGHCPPF